MKRPYTPPHVVTREVHFGVYGDYGSQGGDQTFTGGPAAPQRLGGWGQDTGS